jgi:hypothetical protein
MGLLHSATDKSSKGALFVQLAQADPQRAFECVGMTFAEGFEREGVPDVARDGLCKY